jgi:pyocin large subunit-like protein
VGFADSRRLEEHYEKHGAEFGHISKQDYLRQAQLLRDAKAGGPVLETVRADRVTTRFDRETGAFIAFNPDGTIRTFFKPNDGERYYHRQASRVGE